LEDALLDLLARGGREHAGIPYEGYGMRAGYCWRLGQFHSAGGPAALMLSSRDCMRGRSWATSGSLPRSALPPGPRVRTSRASIGSPKRTVTPMGTSGVS